ncbi:helix-turn-helix transcriptional regulator [Streptomyces luteireticuli]|uniref:HTH cro/C1-type domain-containing protein n=1 Tax=Streptomyces luteireticuli TaxID=173858 RepID=A0ABN0Z685_9ACTN
MTQDFAEWLVGMLKQRGMSQKALADLIEVTPAAVNAWVSGRSEPRYEKITAIAEALGVTVEDAVSRRSPGAASSELSWIFRKAPADGGREGGNAAAFAFTASLEVLAREAVQNSLDERLSGSDAVTSRFVLHELTGQRLHSFLKALQWSEIEKHLHAAADPGQKVGRVLRDGLQELERTQRLVLLRVDDFNASGLTGPEYADGRFARVMRRTLDSGKAGTQGGSYGLGKAALWAASRFGLVLVNSSLSESQDGRRERRMAGRLELPWHALGADEYAGPAWFGVADHERDDAARSWWGDRPTAESLYLERDDLSPGTSFLVVGAYDGSGDTEELEGMHERLVEGVARNFWASMVGGENSSPLLRASVESWRNGRPVQSREVIDPHRYEPARSRAVMAFLDGRTVPELTARDDVLQMGVTLKLPRLKGPVVPDSTVPDSHDAVLLITPAGEEEGKTDHISYMRSTRMVVRDKKVGDLPLGHRSFQAVLLAGAATGKRSADAEAAELLLRAAEPPDHNDWIGTEDLTATYERGARQCVLNFKRDAEQSVRDALRMQEIDRIEDEGPEVLKELLRLDPPKSSRTQGFPTVHSASGEPDARSAWRVRVEVKYPDSEDPWVIAPVVRFVGRDGGGIPVRWDGSLEPVRNCELTEGGNLLLTGSRRAVFTGVTDPDSHPVPAAMSCIEVDVPRAKETTA